MAKLKRAKGVTDVEKDKAIEFMAKTAGEAERVELKEQVNKVYQEFREAKPKRGKDKTAKELADEYMKDWDNWKWKNHLLDSINPQE